MSIRSSMLLIVALLFLALSSMIGWSFYSYYTILHANETSHSYILSLSGNVTLWKNEEKILLEHQESYGKNADELLEVGDIIDVSSWAMAVIYWPDQSVSRLSWGSRLVIETLNVSSDLSQIQIATSLEKWRVWSNVVRAMFGNSYFTTRVPNYQVTAAVRWTVYEIDAENDYIHSMNHAITLEDANGKKNTIIGGEIVKISDIFTKLKATVLDPIWIYMNTSFDKNHQEELTTYIKTSVELLQPKNIIDRFVLWILSFSKNMRTLIDYARISSTNTISISGNASREALIRWYQDLQSQALTAEKVVSKIELQDKILSSIPESEKASFREVFARSNIFESIDSPELSSFFKPSLDLLEKNGIPGSVRDILQKVQSTDYKTLQKDVQSFLSNPTISPDAVESTLQKMNTSIQKFLNDNLPVQ